MSSDQVLSGQDYKEGEWLPRRVRYYSLARGNIGRFAARLQRSRAG